MDTLWGFGNAVSFCSLNYSRRSNFGQTSRADAFNGNTLCFGAKCTQNSKRFDVNCVNWNRPNFNKRFALVTSSIEMSEDVRLL